MTTAFTSPTGLCDLCCCHGVIARSVFPQKTLLPVLESGAQLHEFISINTYGDIPTRQVRIYSCVDASGTVGTSKYKWKRRRELEGTVDRLRKRQKDKERLVGVIRRSRQTECCSQRFLRLTAAALWTCVFLWQGRSGWMIFGSYIRTHEHKSRLMC